MSRRLAALAVALTASLAFAASAQAGDYIVVLKDGVSEPAVASDHAKKGAKVFQHYKHALKGYAATLSDPQFAAVRADSRVAFVAPDEEVRATAPPCLNRGSTLSDNPTPQCLPWNVDRIDGESSSTVSGDGTGSVNVNVAVLDTGIDIEHPDLSVVGGKDCASGSASGKSFDDLNGHGTHVAGTIAAKDDGIGLVGVAPGAPLWAVRVLSRNSTGSTSTVVCGIDFVTGTRLDANPSNDIRVANMSLGGKGADDGNCGRTKKDPTHVAICNSVAAGVTYAVSAGNESVDLATRAPAAYGEVLAVTALSDFDGQPGGTATLGPTTGGDPCPNAGGEADDTPAGFSNFAAGGRPGAHRRRARALRTVDLAPSTLSLARRWAAATRSCPARAWPPPTSPERSRSVLPLATAPD